MKRIFIIFCLLICSFSMSAQKNRVRDAEYFPRNEIYVQYGAPTIIELSTVLTAEINSENYQGDSENHKFSGVAGVGYNFYITPRVSLGIYGGVGYASADMYIARQGETIYKEPVKLCKSKVMSYVGELSGSYTYWQRGNMELSGAVYLGFAFQDEDIDLYTDKYYIPKENDRWKVSYHLTALKFRIGEAIGGFAELGFGYRGLVNVGLSIKI